jgi:DNA-binding CsgD family transcriptional regulator
VLQGPRLPGVGHEDRVVAEGARAAHQAFPQGGQPVSVWRNRFEQAQARAGPQQRAYALSRREREVATLLLRGLSTAEIATTLSISGHTAHDHLKAIYAKTGARGRGRLAARLAPRDNRDL